MAGGPDPQRLTRNEHAGLAAGEEARVGRERELCPKETAMAGAPTLLALKKAQAI